MYYTNNKKNNKGKYMYNSFKALSIVLIAPVVLSICFATNVIKSTKTVRGPAIEVVKQYHFNKQFT